MVTTLFVLTVLLWIVCPLLIGLILLQGGAGDISSAFGGGGSLDSTLGVGAGRKMSKITAWLAAFFFIAVTVLAIPREGNLARAAGERRVSKMPPAVPAAQAPAGATAPIKVTPAPATSAPMPTIPAAAPATTPAAPAVPEVPATVPALPTASPVAPAIPAPPVVPPAVQPTAAAPSVPAVSVPATPAAPPRSGLQLEPPAK